MRRLIISIVCAYTVLLGSSALAYSEIDDAFFEVAWEDSRAAKLKEARDLAIQFTSRAIPLLEGEDKIKAEKILRKLPEIRLAFPKPNDPFADIVCSRKNTVMTAGSHGSWRFVYICNYLLEAMDRIRAAYVAEVLIHEAMHLIGFSGECTATQMESLILDITTEKGSAKDGYYACCVKNNWNDKKCY